MMNEQDRKVFDNNYLVVGLPQEAKDKIAETGRLEERRVSDLLIVEGEKASDLIIILRGTVGVYLGKEKVREIGPGEVIGEIALVDDQPRSANAVALTPVTLLRYEGKALRRYMVENKDMGFMMLANLARVLSYRLREASDQVESLLNKTRDTWENAL